MLTNAPGTSWRFSSCRMADSTMCSHLQLVIAVPAPTRERTLMHWQAFTVMNEAVPVLEEERSSNCCCRTFPFSSSSFCSLKLRSDGLMVRLIVESAGQQTVQQRRHLRKILWHCRHGSILYFHECPQTAEEHIAIHGTIFLTCGVGGPNNWGWSWSQGCCAMSLDTQDRHNPRICYACTYTRLQLFRDLCRKHAAAMASSMFSISAFAVLAERLAALFCEVYDLCPLLRPVRREVPEGGAHSPFTWGFALTLFTVVCDKLWWCDCSSCCNTNQAKQCCLKLTWSYCDWAVGTMHASRLGLFCNVLYMTALSFCMLLLFV